MRRTWRSIVLGAVAVSVLTAGTNEAPANDAPEDATVIESLPFVDEFDASAATGSVDELSGCSRSDWDNRSVWYRFRPDRDMKVELKRDAGIQLSYVIPVDGCRPWQAAHHVSLEAGTDYLIRAGIDADVEDVATFAIREYVPHELDIELSLLAQLVDGSLHLTATVSCQYPGEVNLIFYAAQPNNDYNTMPRTSDPVYEQAYCDEEVEHHTVLDPDRDRGDTAFLPGPVTIFWDVDGCHFDDFRYAGWSDCFHRAHDEFVVAVPGT